MAELICDQPLGAVLRLFILPLQRRGIFIFSAWFGWSQKSAILSGFS
jgi:hypothetical protein